MSQICEEFLVLLICDFYCVLFFGYLLIGDFEWQDEFDFEMEFGDQGFKQMFFFKLQMLQKQLINEFYDGDNMEMKKKKILESKVRRFIVFYGVNYKEMQRMLIIFNS